MGFYLNSQSPAAAYKKTFETPYFVDKTALLAELFAVIGTDDGNICLTRPRRFGKTVVANMIAAFFGKGCDSSAIFDHLATTMYLWLIPLTASKELSILLLKLLE